MSSTPRTPSASSTPCTPDTPNHTPPHTHPGPDYSQEGIAAAKRELRSAIRRRRASVPTPEREARDASIQARILSFLQNIGPHEETSTPPTAPTKAPLTVAAFSPLPGEPGGPTLPHVLAAAGYRVILPRVSGPDASHPHKYLQWCEYCENPLPTSADNRDRGGEEPFTSNLAPGVWGIPEPVGPEFQPFFTNVDAILVPGLAIDRRGRRLGQGGGFYDRALAEAPQRINLCAVIDHEDFLDVVPATSLDLTVENVVTDMGVYDTSHKSIF